MKRSAMSRLSGLVLGGLLAAGPTIARADAETQFTAPEAQHYAKLAEQYKGMGASGYKTGLVQRAEADAQRAQERADKSAAEHTTTPAASPETYPGACDANDPWMQQPDCWK